MHPNLILLIHCPDREGLVASVTSLIRKVHGNIVDLDQHVDAERGVFFMRVEWTPPADPDVVERFERDFRRRGRRPLRHALAAGAGKPAPATGDLRLEVQPLPVRPALPLAVRRVGGGHPGHRQQPRGPRARRARLRRPVRAHSGHSRQQGGGGSPAARPAARGAHRPRRARPLHADPVAGLHRRHARARDQHPPLVPAGLRGRAAVSRGLHARREDHRRDEPLRHGRSRRRARSSRRTW